VPKSKTYQISCTQYYNSDLRFAKTTKSCDFTNESKSLNEV
jgi:hypothetical protein